MADKMMRIAGRGEDGTAKAISADNQGRLNVNLESKEVKEIRDLLIRSEDESIVNKLNLDIFKNKSDFISGQPDWFKIENNSLKMTTTGRSDQSTKVEYFRDDNPIFTNGKYFKFWLELDGNIDDYQFVRFSIGTSRGSWDVIHQISLTKEIGLVSGGQWVEAHVEEFNVKVGTLNLYRGISRMQFELRGTEGKNVSAKISNISITHKKPYIVYGFDGAYPGVVEDAVNYNIPRNIPFFIQLTKHNANELPEGNPARTSSLDKIKQLADTDLCTFGIHFDTTGQWSDGQLNPDSPISEYRQYYRDQIEKLKGFGLLDKQPSHATALQNNWNNSTHHNVAKGLFPVLRSGNNITKVSVVADGKYHYQSPGTYIKDMPFYDLDQETPETVGTLVKTLVDNQYGLYLYSHGTHIQMSNPDYPYKTTPETFEKFWDVVDSYKDEIRFISIEELIEEYNFRKIGRFNYLNKDLNYRGLYVHLN